MLPTFLPVVAIAASLLQDVLTMAILLSIGLVSMFALYAFWVPLLPEQLSSPSMVEAGRARVAARKRGGQL
jgi:hypothetical protein